MRSRIAFTALALLVVSASCSSKSKYEPQADREGIGNTVRQRLAELTTCYHAAIDKRPGAEGKMVLEWEIKPDGKVDQLSVKSVDPKIESATGCVMEKVSRWQFPKPPRGEAVTITYPFIFTENGRLTPSK